MIATPADTADVAITEGDGSAVLSGELRFDALAGTAAAAAALRAWREDRRAPMHRFDGEYALALTDGGEMLLTRSPSGLRPLYWHRSPGGRLCFASELETLMTRGGIERRTCRRALHEYLRLLDITPPRSWYAGVRVLEAGSALWAAGDHIEASHAAAPADPDTVPDLSFDDAIAALDGHLREAIARRTGGAPHPAAFLSGGVDSALICALASRRSPDLVALTVGFDTAPFDETPIAQRIAAHLGMRHRVLRFKRTEYLAAFYRLAEQSDQPSADPTGPATLLAFEHCLGRHDVVLDGTGADGPLGLMPPRHVRLAVGWASLLPAAGRRSLARLLRTVPPAARFAPIVDFEHPAEPMYRWRGFTRSEIESLCGEPVSLDETTFHRTFERFSRFAHFERYSALMDTTPDDRVAQAMRITGLNLRFPFWDREVQRFLRRLPRDHGWRPAEPKRILRALLARYVPREIWDLPKHGFNFPLTDFLRGDRCKLVRRHVMARGVWQRTGLLDPDGVRRYGERFIAGDDGLTFRIWALVVLGAWLERHGEPR